MNVLGYSSLTGKNFFSSKKIPGCLCSGSLCHTPKILQVAMNVLVLVIKKKVHWGASACIKAWRPFPERTKNRQPNSLRPRKPKNEKIVGSQGLLLKITAFHFKWTDAFLYPVRAMCKDLHKDLCRWESIRWFKHSHSSLSVRLIRHSTLY